MPSNRDLPALPAYLELLQDAGADALIIADVGVLRMARRYAPKVPVHISTQTSILNHEAANYWADEGAERIVLARELSLEAVSYTHLDVYKRQGLTEEKTESFVNMLSEIGHESPIEHVSFTFAIEGVSRSLLAQITRHRIASFSVQSQRYVREKGFEYVVPVSYTHLDVYKRQPPTL